ncbi:hypothetical protein FNF27_07708 [Cafeteria roenbergensis]|uniref:UNC93-like protein MFSD11 n=1 Tax=Cafeteria roenbergensis TaxID=33653 RepID=A0A5A8DI09_CAFRO|nr:hypothetical protein FNF27_07708 [Cafeteria roenbergensis]
MCRSRALWNVCVLGAGFLLLFSAYNTIQGYATTLLGELGDVSLATLYATVSVAVLFAPWLVRAVGAKRALVGGAGAYVVYMLTLVTGVRGLIIAGSVVIGAGSAGLWVGMGLLSNANAAEDAAFGRYLGYFWAFLQLSNVLGNLATFAVLSDVPAGPWLFVGFAVTGSLGTLVLLALRPVPKRPSAAVVVPPRHEGRDGNVDLDLARVLLAEGPAGEFSPGPGPEAEESPTRGGGGGFQAAGGLAAAGSLAAGSLRAAFGPRLLPLLPLFLLTGLELAFWNASLPLLVRPDRVGLVLAAVGAFDAGGAVLFGWLGDAAGRLAVVVIGCACVVLGAGGSIAVAAAGAPASGVSPCGAQLGQVPVLVWATAAAFGLGDAALNTQTFASIGDMFQQAGRRPAKAALHDDAERHDDAAAIANTVFQLFNNIGSALGFYAGIPLPLVVEAKHGGFELGSVAVAVVTASVAVVAAASMFAARGLNTGRPCAAPRRRSSAGSARVN